MWDRRTRRASSSSTRWSPRTYGISVGDQVPFTAFRKGQNATGTPKGAQLRAHRRGDHPRAQPVPVPGSRRLPLARARPIATATAVERIGNSHVRLADPEHDMARFRTDVTRVFPKGTPVLDLHSVERRVGTAISVERLAQMLLGIAVAVAGIVFVGQALARSVATVDDDALVLRGLGFTRSNRTTAGVLPHLLSAAVALPVAFAGALVLSPRFPIGYARTVDPNVGRARRLDGHGARPRRARPPRRRRRGRRGLAAERPARRRTPTRAPNVRDGGRAAAGAAAGRPRHDDGVRVRTRPSQRARAAGAARGDRRACSASSGPSPSSTASTTRSPTRSGPASRGTRPCWRASHDYTDQVDALCAGVRRPAQRAARRQRRGDPRAGRAGRRRRRRRGLRRQAGAGLAQPRRGRRPGAGVGRRGGDRAGHRRAARAADRRPGRPCEGRSARTFTIVGRVALPERGALGVHRGALDHAGGDAGGRDRHRLRGADRDGAVRRGALARAAWTATPALEAAGALHVRREPRRSDRPRCRPSSRT